MQQYVMPRLFPQTRRDSCDFVETLFRKGRAEIILYVPRKRMTPLMTLLQLRVLLQGSKLQTRRKDA